MTDTVTEKWEQFLDPRILRTKLIAASLYIAAFEMLKDSIVGRIRDFYTTGFDESGWIVDQKYAKEVLSRNKSPLYASLSWLRENDVIFEQDLEAFERIKSRRNAVAHSLPGIVTATASSDFIEVFPSLVALLRKIEVWWIVNVEIPTNPDFDNAEIDESGIVPGPLITVQIMLSIALGSDEESTQFLEAFRKAKT